MTDDDARNTPSPPLDVGAVFAELEYMRGRGELATAVTTAYPRYQAAPSRPGSVEQIAEDGTRTVGMFSGGHFVEVSAQ